MECDNLHPGEVRLVCNKTEVYFSVNLYTVKQNSQNQLLKYTPHGDTTTVLYCLVVPECGTS